MRLKKVGQVDICAIVFFMMLLLAGCVTAQPTPKPDTPISITMTPKVMAAPSLTASPQPSTTQKTQSATPAFDWTAEALTNPPPTPTRTPVVDADGNVTWHPQEKLISWSDGGGDGVYYYYNNFTLFWDGSLFLPGNTNEQGIPYAIQLSHDEVCKLLNTVDASGFFGEPSYYNFPFDGLGGSDISVNAWKSNQSGSQILASAISGDPYFDMLFCRNCPIPSEGTIIQPGLANMYYFLRGYHPPSSQKVPLKEILVQVNESMYDVNSEWSLTSMTLNQFEQAIKNCREEPTCYSEGMAFEGDVAKEIMEKIGNANVFKSDLWGVPISITYGPKAPNLPPDYTITCNTKSSHYPLLPLNHQNKFWYYASNGKWGAEVIASQNKIRVVNITGYEKFYQYDAAFFGQVAIQVYPRFWSKDGQFFYVNILPGDYIPNVSLVNSIGLQQIDVKNEKIKYVFLGTQGQTFAYELSTDGKKLAYIRQGDHPLKLVVQDLYTGEERSVSLTMPSGIPYTSAGTIIWSPDDKKLFIAASYEENGQQKGHILTSYTTNLADIRVIYNADKSIKLRPDYGSANANICDLQTDGDTNCLIDLYFETEKIEDWSK